MSVGVKELRDGLSRHLDLVRDGHTVTVTEHGRPFARIVPIGAPTSLERLVAEGRVAPSRRQKQPSRAPIRGLAVSLTWWPSSVAERAVIAYLDTSAFVPLLVAEPGTSACRALWDAADEVVATRLLYVETAAALAAAERLGRLGLEAHEAALDLLAAYWADLRVLELDAELMLRSAQLGHVFALRGYDAVHCAAAELLDDPELVAASGDRALLQAWTSLGLAVYDPNLPGVAAQA